MVAITCPICLPEDLVLPVYPCQLTSQALQAPFLYIAVPLAASKLEYIGDDRPETRQCGYTLRSL